MRVKYLFSIPALLLITIVPCFSLAQESEGAEESLAPKTGEWKKNFASPSIGVVLYKARVRQRFINNSAIQSPFMEDEYYTPAVETRIFRGFNITRRAGFYAGVEAGAVIFVPSAKTFFDSVTINDPDSTIWNRSYYFKTSLYGGTVFAMLKYGYRFYFPFIGLSAGFQLGTGASLFNGGYDVYIGDRDTTQTKSGSSTGETTLSLATDFSLELALRLKKNFRFFAAAGILMTPMELKGTDFSNLPGSEILSTTGNTDTQYYRYALSNYEVEIDGFGFSMRAGFGLNFD